jgi:hypothetical protein
VNILQSKWSSSITCLQEVLVKCSQGHTQTPFVNGQMTDILTKDLTLSLFTLTDPPPDMAPDDTGVDAGSMGKREVEQTHFGADGTYM